MDHIRAPRRSTHAAIILTLIAGCALPELVQAQAPADVDVAKAPSQSTVDAWSDGIWAAAISGDEAALDAYLDSVPEGALPEKTSELRADIEAYRTHLEEAEQDRTEDRLEARTKMMELFEEEKIVEALTAAVNLQTLSDDWSTLLKDEVLRELVARAEVDQAEARAAGDWLLAQELLYRLRTLYEDTADADRYRNFNEQLDDVNRRIGLLAQYAPRTLHELRRAEIARLAPDEELPEFDEAFADDWKELLEDVNERVLKSALGLAAREHIASAGWKPLLEGGIEALRIFITTSALKENFPSIAMDEPVARFDSFLEIHENRIKDMPSDAVTPGTCRRLLQDILLAI